MSSLPLNPSKSFIARNPHIYAALWPNPVQSEKQKRIRQSSKPILNKTEQRYFELLASQGRSVLKQAITLRLDPPYKSYRPDLAYLSQAGLCLVEVKGPHRFRKAGIAKAALAAKTYPWFHFVLADWTGTEWKESVLSP